MATAYAINGTTTAIAPYSQRWRQVQTGTDHTQRTIFSGNEEIDLLFPGCSVTEMREWMEAASGGSLTATVLTRYGIGYTDLSGVYLQAVEYPDIQAGVSGPWSMIVKGASAA